MAERCTSQASGPETHQIFDELFIGVRSGPALYCFDVTNDDGMALMDDDIRKLCKKQQLS